MPTTLPAFVSVIFLAAAILFSLLGRILLVGKALGVSRGWGITVLFAPFGPMFFRLKYEDLANPTRYWRMPIGPLMLLFFLSGGSVFSVHALMAVGGPGGATPFSVVAALLGHNVAPAAAPATPAPQVAPVVAQATPPPTATPSSTSVVAKAASAPKSTPSSAVTAAASKMAPAPSILNLTDRLEANRQEFVRLSDWYDSLKHERGYLRKGDTDAVEAYNTEAAKYQTALQLAKTEQAELAKLTAKK